MRQRGSQINDTLWVIRVYTANCRYRFELSPYDTYQVLVDQICAKTGYSYDQLEICTANGKHLNIQLQRKIKDVIYLSHGSILQVRLPSENKISAGQSIPSFISNDSKLSNNSPRFSRQTPRLSPNTPNHINSPKQANSPTVSPRQSKAPNAISSPTNNPQQSPRCKHSPSTKCPKCAKTPDKVRKIVIVTHEKEKPKEAIPNPASKQTESNKCSHGQTGKCLKCFIDSKVKDSSPTKKECNHGENTKCVNCLDSVRKAAHASFDGYLADKRGKCDSHSKESSCVHCLPPTNLRLKVDKTCHYHRPYPHGLCDRCKPNNVTLKRQEYRHVDYVQFMNQHQIQDFIQFWLHDLKKKEMRVGFLYGYYAEDPYYHKGIRAIVEALYEPHQQCTEHDFRILDSPSRREHLELIAQSLGLQRVGVIITSASKNSPLTEKQLRLIAGMQEELSVSHETGYKLSNYFTVIIRQTGQPNKPIEPEVFMVSDQGQALVASHLLIPNSNPSKMRVREQVEDEELLPTVYLQGKPTNQFQLEFLLVNVAAGMDKTRKFAILKNNRFPPSSRGRIRRQQVKQYVKTSPKGRVNRFGDLNLLLFVGEVLDLDTAMSIGTSVAEQQEIDESVSILVDKYLERLI